jgi:hypothetical protein
VQKLQRSLAHTRLHYLLSALIAQAWRLRLWMYGAGMVAP